MTIFESLQLMLVFGMFIISLLMLVVVLIKLDKKKITVQTLAG
ncbi:putative holin-like toxin [Brochothrix thermosphacta]